VWREILKLLALLAVLFALLYFLRRGGNFVPQDPPPATLVDTHLGGAKGIELCGAASLGMRPLPIEMVYSEDLRSWIEPALDKFARACPNIQVRLTAMPDIEAADAILAGRVQPTIWAATDDLSLLYLEHRWTHRGDELPFSRRDRMELVHSPLVALIWQDRLRLLTALLRGTQSEEGRWTRSLCAGIARDPDLTGLPQENLLPGTWSAWYEPMLAALAPVSVVPVRRGKRLPPPLPPPPPPPAPRSEPLPTLDQVRAWGRVKLGHTSPTRDSAGLAALYLLSYDYLLPPKSAPAASDGGARDEKSPSSAASFEDAYSAGRIALRKWLRRCEGGLDLPPRSARQLTANLFNVGPSLYDGVITYEHLALPYLDRVDTHAAALGRLAVVYPEPTLMARHPAVMFRASPEKKEAAERWLKYLLSKPMQQAAVDSGFRPVSPEVTLRGYDAETNAFLRLRRYGVVIQPTLAEAPRISGKTVQSLIELWGEVTGRN
jgi:hypothetical protein